MPFLLVTTSKSLLLLETTTGSCYCVDTGRDHYYGIARGFGCYYVGARYRANTSPIPKELERGRILRLGVDGSLLDEMEPPFPLRDMHQMLVHNGRLWVTCSYDNMIATFDGSSWDRWFPVGKPDGEPYDKNHFNSLAAFGDALCVVAHNWSVGSGKSSELLFFHMPDMSLDQRISLGSCSHNVWLHRGELMTCSSAEGCLVGERGLTVSTGGFPRGVAYVGNEICIGVTEFASRPERDLGKGWIRVYDHDWKGLRTLEIHDQGMITDILGISDLDAERMRANADIRPLGSVSLLHDS